VYLAAKRKLSESPGWELWIVGLINPCIMGSEVLWMVLYGLETEQ
jgi:hypothetical protein